MNESSDEQASSVPQEEPETTETASETREAFKDLGDAVKNAFRAGTRDARKAAKNAVPRAGKEFSKGVHDIAYGVAYLASFGLGLARELTPDPVCDGFSEGTDAGRKAAETVMEKRRRAAERSGEAVDAGETDSGQPEAVPV